MLISTPFPKMLRAAIRPEGHWGNRNYWLVFCNDTEDLQLKDLFDANLTPHNRKPEAKKRVVWHLGSIGDSAYLSPFNIGNIIFHSILPHTYVYLDFS